MARDQSESRKATVRATGSGSWTSHPRGALEPHEPASRSKPGIPFAAMVRRGPAETQLTRTPFGPPPPRGQLAGHRGDLALVVGVHLQDVGRLGEPTGRLLGQAPGPPEPGQDDLGAFLLGDPGGLERDALRREDAGDQQALTL